MEDSRIKKVAMRRDLAKLADLGCNTPGVCHSLSSGFELKHDRLSGDEPNLNLDVTPLLYL
jgi:hypothetical protein